MFSPKPLPEQIVCCDGLSLLLRPISAEDAPHLINLFNHLSPESRYQRFHQVVDHMSPTRLRGYADQMIDASIGQDFGLLAFMTVAGNEPEPVAGARFVVGDGDSAEFAITIRDDMHRRGIGSLLLGRLITEARRRGIRQLTGTALAENIAIWKLLTRTGLPLDRWYDAREMHFSLSLFDCCEPEQTEQSAGSAKTDL